MKKNSKKILVGLTSGIIISTSVFTTGLAAALQKVQGVVATDASITKNSKMVSLGIDEVTGKPYYPIMIDNRAYVPLRAMGEIAGMEIGWDNAKRQVKMTEKASDELSHYIGLDVTNKVRISELEKQIKDLEKKLEEKKEKEKEKEKDTKDTLKTLESDLNKKFDSYEGVKFDIKATGNEKDIKVEVLVRKDYFNEWDRLDERRIKNYAEDIYDYIYRDYRNAKIVGTIDGGRDATYVDFGEDRSGRFDITIKFGKTTPSSDKFEDRLNEAYKKEFKDDLRYIDLKLDIRRDTVDVNVDIHKDDWLRLSAKTRSKFFEDVIYDVEREYRGTKVTVTVKDRNETIESSRK